MGGEDLGDIFGVGWFMRILRGGICRLRRELGAVRGIYVAVHAVERSNGHAGQSFRLACLSGKNPGGVKTPDIERPSFGRGCIGGEDYAGVACR